MKLRIAEQDIIYLSYDEPNAEENYADLLTKAPWAKRIHGVKGSDAAHKACAELSETDRFITVDGDNKIRSDFINQVLDFDEHADLENTVISWCGQNKVNGLMYGNGGLKCWPKEYVLNMRTHENAEPDNVHAQVDFCWDMQYIQQNSCFSDVYNNATPQQAWRAGFREGVKMSLDQGAKVSDISKTWFQNFDRLRIWCSVGADVENGLWSMYGAREGLYKTMCTDWDYAEVRDFKWLNSYWKDKVQDESDLLEAIEDYGNKLRSNLGLEIAELDANGSHFFKSLYHNTQE